MAFDPAHQRGKKTVPVLDADRDRRVCGSVGFRRENLSGKTWRHIDHMPPSLKYVAQNTYYPGVTVDGVELGGMTREEAGALFGSRQQETSSAFSLVVQAGERKWRITSDEVPMTFDAQTVLDEA